MNNIDKSIENYAKWRNEIEFFGKEYIHNSGVIPPYYINRKFDDGTNYKPKLIIYEEIGEFPNNIEHLKYNDTIGKSILITGEMDEETSNNRVRSISNKIEGKSQIELDLLKNTTEGEQLMAVLKEFGTRQFEQEAKAEHIALVEKQRRHKVYQKALQKKSKKKRK